MPRTIRRNLSTLLYAGCASFSFSASALAQGARPIHFEVPAQDLSQALNEVAQQSGREIAFDANLTRGKRGPAIKGDYTPQAALDLLLAGSGLHVRTTATGSIIVEATASTPAQSENALGDIVVTARRVRERLQDIPASVSAITGDRAAGLTSIADISSNVSGVTFKTLGPFPTVGIRGFGNRTDPTAQISTVGIFEDGVFVAPLLATLATRVDTDRVEVAKGPQSTLYGRASFTGATIAFRTIRPRPCQGIWMSAAAPAQCTTRASGMSAAPSRFP